MRSAHASSSPSILWNRRAFLKASGCVALWPAAAFLEESVRHGVLVNDVQTESNPTAVAKVVPVKTMDEVVHEISLARKKGNGISICGARHAAGGQQFGSGTTLLDVTAMNRVLSFDRERGTIEVEGGTEWPDLMAYYLKAQKGQSRQWGIAQKQGGLDRLTMGGTLSANAHGHTLTRKPIVGDVESFELIDASGTALKCSRQENAELFRLAIGGYGLFGVISKVRLRLIPRQKLARHVEWADTDSVMAAFEKETAGGALYGDFQYSIDSKTQDFLRRGILTAYRPAGPEAAVSTHSEEVSEADLTELLYLAHSNKSEAFRRYADASLRSSGEVVWSDTHQYSPYPRYYHHALDQRLGSAHPGTDPLAEVYVPRPHLGDFMMEARAELKDRGTNLVYGTIRLIRQDDETFLAWARQGFACVIFTVHMDHTPHGMAETADTFRTLVDLTSRRNGSYYLTYQRFADRKQIEKCYPNFVDFLRLKKKYDPMEVFQSEWYRHYKNVFRGA